MAQIVTDQNGQKHEFPDEATPAMIAAALGATPPTPSSGSGVVDFLKNTSTGVTEGLSGLATLPHDIYNFDPQAWLDRQMGVTRNPPPAAPPKDPNVVTGSDIFNAVAPTPEGMNKFLYDKLGLPYYVPSTPEGRIYQSGVKGTVMGGVPFSPMGAGLGLASGAASQGAAEAGMPGYVQTAASLLAPLGVAAAPTALRTAARIARPLLPGNGSLNGMRRVAADTLYPPGHPTPTFEQPPIPGTPMGTAQATGDPRLISLTRAAGSATGSDTKDVLDTMKSGANQKIVDRLNGFGGVPAAGMEKVQAENASTNMRAELGFYQQKLQKDERDAWNAVPGKGITVPAGPIRADFAAVKDHLAATSRDDLVPGYVETYINTKWGDASATGQTPDTVTLDQLKGLRTRVGNDISAALGGPNPDRNRANVLTQVEDVLQKQMDAITSADPKIQTAIDKARAVTIEKHQTFDDPIVAGALAQTNGFDRVQAARVASRFIRFGGGSQQSFDAYLKATGKSPDAIQAARDYVTAGLMDAGRSTAKDTAGNPYIMAGPFNKFLADNAGLINHPDLFTQDQRDILTSVQKTNDMLARTTQGSSAIQGSDTYSKLTGGRYLDAIVGMKGSAALRLLAGYAGYQVGKTIGAGGGLAGGLGGFAMGGKMINWVYSRPGELARSLVERALVYPPLAEDLVKWRGAPVAPKMGKNLRAFLGFATQETSQQTRQP